MPESSAGFEAVIQIKQLYEGHAKQAMYALWSTTMGWRIKHIIVVEDDIDIRDWNDVHWAIATRVQGDRQITIIPNNPSTLVDVAQPSTLRTYTTYVGIDATRQMGLFTREKCTFPPAGKPTQVETDMVEKRWDEYGIRL